MACARWLLLVKYVPHEQKEAHNEMQKFLLKNLPSRLMGRRILCAPKFC